MFLGVDGCPAGWFVIVLNDISPPYTFALYPRISDLWQDFPQVTRILIDMPIGIPSDQPRNTERQVRHVLQQRRSSVFAVPVRDALYAPTYAEASAMNQQITGKKLSKQTWNIVPKIREVDQFLRSTPPAQTVIHESHPEVVFAMLNDGKPMQYTKKSGLGFYERVKIIQRYLPHEHADTLIISAREAFPASDLADDDILDAMILAIGALLGNLKSIPEQPSCDVYGLLMQVAYPDPRL